MILNGLPCKLTEIILSFLRLHPSSAFQTLVDHDGYSISSKCQTLFWGAPKSLQVVTAAMKLKDTYSLEEKS